MKFHLPRLLLPLQLGVIFQFPRQFHLQLLLLLFPRDPLGLQLVFQTLLVLAFEFRVILQLLVQLRLEFPDALLGRTEHRRRRRPRRRDGFSSSSSVCEGHFRSGGGDLRRGGDGRDGRRGIRVLGRRALRRTQHGIRRVPSGTSVLFLVVRLDLRLVGGSRLVRRGGEPLVALLLLVPLLGIRLVFPRGRRLRVLLLSGFEGGIRLGHFLLLRLFLAALGRAGRTSRDLRPPPGGRSSVELPPYDLLYLRVPLHGRQRRRFENHLYGGSFSLFEILDVLGARRGIIVFRRHLVRMWSRHS
mmetsp:Transcript_42924/g.90139  ORF Transcript_42924/g.90139 Transcript_42924/m.90139 type:complete len:301 (-) Transcript_42924:23-925(-)